MGKKQLWIVIAGLLLLNCLTIAFFWAKAQNVSGPIMNDESVAKIGKHSITRQDWLNELEARYGKEVLKEMIDQQVIQEMAVKYKISISDQEVEREFRMLQATNQTFGPKSYPNEKKWKEQIKSSLLLEEILTRDVNVSKKEMVHYYEKNKDQFNVPEAYHLAHIIVKTKKEAEKAAQELAQGSSFSVLAMERSVDEFSANEGGDIGYITEGDERYPKVYLNTAKKLKKGAYSKPIKVENGYALVKLEGKISGKSYSYEEVKDEIRRQIALGQMKAPASASTLWKDADVEWFFGKNQ